MILWLTSVETSEPVGIPAARIAFLEQKGAREGNVVTFFLDTGQEIRVIEPLATVRRMLDGVAGR